MASSGNTWADLWGSDTTNTTTDQTQIDKSSSKGGGFFGKKYSQKLGDGLGKTKEAASSGVDKTKVVATKGIKKVKEGASVGMGWIKEKCQKTTSKK